MDQLSEVEGGPLLEKVPLFWEQFNAAVDKYPDNVALVSTHQHPKLYGIPSVSLSDDQYIKEPYLRWTYKNLKHGVARLVAGLSKQDVIESTPAIFTFLPNMAEFVLAVWAADRLGCSLVPINPRNLTNKEEVIHMIMTAMSARQSTSAIMFVTSDDVARQIQELDLTFQFKLVVCTPEHSNKDWIAFSDLMPTDLTEDEVSLSKDDKVANGMILFTSGTTSLPKGCFWTQSAMGTMFAQRELLGEASTPSPGDVICIVAPNNHAIGFVFVHIALKCGATIVYSSPSFAPQDLMDTMSREKCTHTGLVPIMVHALLGARASSGGKLETLKSVFLGGSMVSPEIMRQCADGLGADGVENGYGMTEGAVLFSGSKKDWKKLVSGDDVSIGRVMAGQKIRICGPGTRTPVRRGEPGELHVSSPVLVAGYIGKESDDFYIGDDGRRWFVTGDQASIDHNGRVFIVGRYKEMIIRGGENISPAAIENVLAHVPRLAALNVQVLGVPDSIAGEVPVAVINGKADPEIVHELQNTILTKMGSMYIPDEVIPLKALGIPDYPKTMAGKIQKKKLSELVRKYRDASKTTLTNGKDAFGELASSVKHIWSQAVGYEVDEDTPVSNFADSITVMKVRDRISKETGRSISLAEMVESNTISGQVKLLQTQPRQGEGKRVVKRQLRTGPPSCEDLVHLVSDPSLFEDTKLYIEKILSSYNLAWADVEDVVPAYDFGKTLAQTGIFDSWGLRFAISTQILDVAKLRIALESTLTNNRMMASFLMWNSQAFGSDVALHVLVRHRKELFDRCITHVGNVKSVKDLENLAVKYPHPEHSAVPGPLFHAMIAEIEETGRAGMVMSIHHGVMDASYGQLFFEDLDNALGGAQLEEHIDYKTWADSYFALRTSLDAKAATAWHVRRLRGLEKHGKALLPYTGPHPNAKADYDLGAEHGFAYSFEAQGIPALRREHGHITAPIVVKAAVALHNILQNKQTHALFSNLEASRMRFPFVPKALGSLEGYEFEASDVAGPTIETVINFVEIKPEEHVLAFFERMQEEQNNLTKYAAAPLGDVMATLGDKAGPMLLEVLRSRIYNWIPGMGTTGTNPFANFERLNFIVKPDIGLAYNAGLGGKSANTVFLLLTGMAFDRPELQTIAEDLAKITKWLTAKEHWNSPIGKFHECLAAGVNGTSGHG